MRFLPDMLLCPARFFCCILMMGFMFSASFAQAQDEERQANRASEHNDSTAQYEDSTAQYKQLCLNHGVECSLSYGAKKQAELEVPPPRRFRLPDDSDSNLVLIVILCVGFVLILGLWLYFSSGGALLSRTEKVKNPNAMPAGWKKDAENAHGSTGDFFQKIAAMSNRQEALVELLRHCLLHAAKLSDTRLARSDTERAVLRRLPQDLPQRHNLESLLHATELAHYGGETVEEQQFAISLALARDFVLKGHVAYA